MIKIVGLDIANSSGVCFMTAGAPPSKWRALALEVDETWRTGKRKSEHETAASDLVRMLRPLLIEERPSFAVIEQPERSVRTYARKGADLAGETSGHAVNAGTALRLNQLAGAVVGLLEALEIGWGTIAPATWRSVYFGKGQRPAPGTDWKDMARTVAHLQKISLPGTKKADGDAAESAGIACAWRKANVPAFHLDLFQSLLTGRRSSTSSQMTLPTNEVA